MNQRQRWPMIVVIVVTAVSCHLNQPTYVDIDPQTLTELQTEWGVDEEGLWSDGQRLRDALGARLDLKVEKVEVVDGRPVAQITPTTKAAVKKLIKHAPKDPTSYIGWIIGGASALGIIAAGALGRRGRRTRAREKKVANGFKKPDPV